MVKDEPGVLARITKIFGDNDISISSFLQKEPQEDNPENVPLVITTHTAREGNVAAALSSIHELPVVDQAPVLINIVDEHEELI